MELTKQEIRSYAEWINEAHERLYDALAYVEGLLNDPIIRELTTNSFKYKEVLSRLSEILKNDCLYYDDFEAELFASCLGDFDTLMTNIKGE